MMKQTITCCALLLLLCGCAERRHGDPGGVPVTVNAKIERDFYSNMENRQGRPSAGVGVGYSSRGHTSTGVGFGLSFSSTQVYIVGGDAVGQSNVFRQEVKWGDNTFTVPLTPGRTIHLTTVAEGGRRGWEAIGTVVVPQTDPHIDINIAASGVSLKTASKPSAPATPTP